MGKTIVGQITDCIERTFNFGGKDLSKNIIVFPLGDVGLQVISIMEKLYNLKPAYIVDNHKCKFNSDIKPLSYFADIKRDDYVIILASTNEKIYGSLKCEVAKYFKDSQIIELAYVNERRSQYPDCKTSIGKYSYGPICHDHILIESIGAFCSFAAGVDVVANHESRYITTHPMLYAGKELADGEYAYENCKECSWYFPGVNPIDVIEKEKRITIGNDVWLGRNVIITNSSNIGNGVIAGAGAIITKDIPDYAVVVGTPARIVRFRYTEKQIEALNKISWWNWSDEDIRRRYMDFYLPIDNFIMKYV